MQAESARGSETDESAEVYHRQALRAERVMKYSCLGRLAEEDVRVSIKRREDEQQDRVTPTLI